MVKIVRFARASLRFDQKMEDVIVKSDVNIKKENLDPENNYDQSKELRQFNNYKMHPNFNLEFS